MPRFSRSGCPCLQTAAVILTAVALFSACKARNESTSRVRSDSATSSNSSELGVAWLLDQIETDLARIEPEVQLAGDPMANRLDVQGLALADNSIDERQHMLDLAKDLDSYAADKVIANRGAVEAVAEELEGLADLLSGLSASDKKRAADAVSRVRAILASPPNNMAPANIVHATPPPAAQQQTPAQQTTTENDASSLYCKNLGNSSWLPAIRNGIVLGFAAQSGNQGFTKNSNCQSAIDNSRNGLVCSISSNDKVSPFRISNGEMVGPKVGFAQTANCVAAVRASNSTICLVDNRNEVRKYAKYNVATGAVVDYWFDDADRCARGDKSPDPRLVCLERCQTDYDRCYQRAQRLTGMGQTSARIQCLHDRIVVCEKRCG